MEWNETLQLLERAWSVLILPLLGGMFWLGRKVAQIEGDMKTIGRRFVDIAEQRAADLKAANDRRHEDMETASKSRDQLQATMTEMRQEMRENFNTLLNMGGAKK